MTPRKFYELVDPHEHGGFNKDEMKKVQDDIDSVNEGKKIDFNSLFESSPVKKKELQQLLFDTVQLLDGYRQDDTWSDWDEEVRNRVFELYKKLST